MGGARACLPAQGASAAAASIRQPDQAGSDLHAARRLVRGADPALPSGRVSLMSAPIPIDHPAVAVTLPGPSGARHNAVCIDTATSMAALALIQDGQVVAETAWRVGKSHTRQLSTKLDRKR